MFLCSTSCFPPSPKKITFPFFYWSYISKASINLSRKSGTKKDFGVLFKFDSVQIFAVTNDVIWPGEYVFWLPVDKEVTTVRRAWWYILLIRYLAQFVCIPFLFSPMMFIVVCRGTASNSVQSSLKDTVSFVPNYYNKVNIAIKSFEFFAFPVQIKAIFTL